MKRMLYILLALLLGSTVAACSKSNDTQQAAVEKKELVFGGSSMPYSKVFEAGVKPILEKKGYQIKTLNFSTLEVNNTAIDEGSVDFNLDQHTAYLEVFNKNKKTHLYPLVHIPLIPAAIYSAKYKSFAEAPDGATVVIPQDPSNTARALRILEKAGLIKIDPNVEPVLINVNNIIDNPRNFNIKPIDSMMIPRALADFDFGHISGGIAYQAKVDPKLAVVREDVIPELEMVVTIHEKNKDTQWAKDLKAAYQSQEFKDFMANYDKDGLWVMPKG